MRADRFSLLATEERYGDAVSRLNQPGDCAIVERGGVRRQLVILCPDGCGETLSINLDRRSGPAWRLLHRRESWSLFPSIDKPSRCLSHFILWRDHILWCDWEDAAEGPDIDTALVGRVVEILQDTGPIGFVELAEKLDEVPWDVLGACRQLVKAAVLEEQSGHPRGIFLVKPPSAELPGADI
jgi:Family of unknown function (DUF6527)